MAFSFLRKRNPAAPDTPAKPLPGVLTGLRYASSGGSMVYRSTFEIELTPQEIVQ